VVEEEASIQQLSSSLIAPKIERTTLQIFSIVVVLPDYWKASVWFRWLN